MADRGNAGFGARRRGSSATGLVVRGLSRVEVVRLEEDLGRRRRFDLAEVAFARVGPASRSATDLRAAWSSTLAGIRRFGGAPVEERLLTLIDADPDTARVLLHLAGHCLSGQPFVLVLTGSAGDPWAPADLVEVETSAIAEALGGSVRTVDHTADARRVRLVRPTLRDPVADVPADLCTIVLGPDEQVPAAVDRWLTGRTVHELPGFSIVGPVVAERMRHLGIRTELTPLIDGMHRRVWYRNAMLRDVAVQAVVALRSAGIVPTLLGDLAVAVEAERAGTLRSMGEMVLLVDDGDLERAWSLLAEAFGIEIGSGPTAAQRQARRIPIVIGDGRRLLLTSRWLPGRGDRRVPLDPTATGPIEIDGVTVDRLLPTARLLERWCRAFDLRRHDRLATTLDVLGVLADDGPGGARSAIDGTVITRACARLELPSPV